MKYSELEARLAETVAHPDYAVSWYVPGEYDDSSYTIVPLDDGNYTLYRPDGRGQYYQDVDAESNPRMFASEDDVCDYVWTVVTTPPRRVKSTTTFVQPTVEESAQRRREVLESLGLDHDPYAISPDQE